MNGVAVGAIGAAGGAVTGLGGTVLASTALGAAGFAEGGIIAGSIAAGIQSGIGSVAAGSAFATLQSIGATGAIMAAGPFITVGGAVAGTIAGIAYFWNKKKK